MKLLIIIFILAIACGEQDSTNLRFNEFIIEDSKSIEGNYILTRSHATLSDESLDLMKTKSFALSLTVTDSCVVEVYLGNIPLSLSSFNLPIDNNSRETKLTIFSFQNSPDDCFSRTHTILIFSDFSSSF